MILWISNDIVKIERKGGIDTTSSFHSIAEELHQIGQGDHPNGLFPFVNYPESMDSIGNQFEENAIESGVECYSGRRFDVVSLMFAKIVWDWQQKRTEILRSEVLRI